MPKHFNKQPAENLDYDFKWQYWLEPTGGDLIIANAVTVTVITPGSVELPATLVLGPNTISSDGYSVKQFVSGGIDGIDYKLSCLMTTSAGRKDEAEIYIHVRDI